MPKTLTFSLLTLFLATLAAPTQAQLKTWDKKHSIERIDLTVVYFLPQDREPLPDWQDRVRYYCRRIEQFHEREFQGQSKLNVTVRTEPLRSAQSTAQLRDGDGDFIFFKTLREADQALQFGRQERQGFPILLVLSDINWRPLDDFYRVKPDPQGGWVFEGNYSNGRHFPGAAAGGARATYLADRGVGWGLVSADGWRVPYRGSDCVIYHEGCGHTVGLPHPRQGNNSVMSLGQYAGWISESWLDEDQKARLGWKAPEQPFDRRSDLFSKFTALAEPPEPKPNSPVSLQLTWPANTRVKSCRVRLQTDLWGPWLDVVTPPLVDQQPPTAIGLGGFDRATPVSYRVDATTTDDRTVELWGYFQVRDKPELVPTPRSARPSNN